MYSSKFTVILISVVFSVELNTQKYKNIVQCCWRTATESKKSLIQYVETKVLRITKYMLNCLFQYYRHCWHAGLVI